MKTADFDYDLPEDLIAQAPPTRRGDSRLLVIDPQAGDMLDAQFSDLQQFVSAGDLLVFNDTRVFPARLFGHKASGGKVEVLVERLIDTHEILAMVRASKSPREGAELLLEGRIACRVLGREGEFFRLRQDSADSWLDLLGSHGHIPLPPYIQRQDEDSDHERYQTVYARSVGAVAAPTAGLHFNEAMLQRLKENGVGVEFVTLHVGAGTFQPVRVDDVAEHRMHAELVEVSPQVVDRIRQTRQSGGRVIAVGTTVVRSLESAAAGGELQEFSGDTRLFITPGFEFRVVDAMLTNFHLPRSTLIMMISAFAGREFILDAYAHAVQQRYRFFSYGDAMLIRKRLPAA
jgi:S-adenosylmethionine:tRNA ribosyltransferase-isomerase